MTLTVILAGVEIALGIGLVYYSWISFSAFWTEGYLPRRGLPPLDDPSWYGVVIAVFGIIPAVILMTLAVRSLVRGY